MSSGLNAVVVRQTKQTCAKQEPLSSGALNNRDPVEMATGMSKVDSIQSWTQRDLERLGADERPLGWGGHINLATSKSWLNWPVFESGGHPLSSLRQAATALWMASLSVLIIFLVVA